MTDTLEITLGEPEAVEPPLALPPRGSTAIGPAPAEGFRIYLRQETAAWIDGYASTDVTQELGGLLVGGVCRDEAGEFVLIEGAVEAARAHRAAASITFTHEAWDEMARRIEEEWPGRRIVGWFHTHPGFGIFLSSYDVFIHRHFFDLPWQVAYVVDPRRRTRGFFQWNEGAVAAAVGHYAYVAAGPAATTPPPALASEPPRAPVEPAERTQPLAAAHVARDGAMRGRTEPALPSAPEAEPTVEPFETRVETTAQLSPFPTAAPPKGGPSSVAIALAALAVLFAVAVDDVRQRAEVSRLTAAVQRMRGPRRAAPVIVRERPASSAGSPASVGGALNPSRDTAHRAEQQSVTGSGSDPLVGRTGRVPGPASGASPPAPRGAGRLYRVRRGDTLSGISRRVYGTPDQFALIQRANPGLNPLALQQGQELTIPSR
jgi:nucleoid-associated protein YgaU